VVAILSTEEIQRLQSLDRRAMHVSELTDDEIAALDTIEIPEETRSYNPETV
jgi:hypothetical protein